MTPGGPAPTAPFVRGLLTVCRPITHLKHTQRPPSTFRTRRFWFLWEMRASLPC